MKKLILIPLLFISLICQSATYYVKTGWNDANTGLSDAQAWAHHPWMSTWTGSVTLAPGDIVRMNRGDTWTIANPVAAFMTISESGTSGNYIITSTYGAGAKPIINISTDSNYPVIGGTNESYIIIDSLEITHYASTYDDTGIQNGIMLGGTVTPSHNWIIRWCDIHDIPHYGIGTTGNCFRIVVGDTTATATATASAYSNQIYDVGFGGVGLGSCDPVTLESYNKVYYNYIHDINTSGTVVDNTYGIVFGGSADSPGYSRHCYAKYNRLEDIPNWHGYDHHNGAQMYITDNYFYNVQGSINVTSTTFAGGPDPVCDTIYVERNIIENSGNHYDTYYYGMAIEGVSDTYPCRYIIIRDNTIFYTARPTTESSGFGIRIRGSDGVLVEDNHIYNGDYAQASSAISIGATGKSTLDITVKNNYIVNWWPAITISPLATAQDVTISYNVVYGFARLVGTLTTGTLTGTVYIYNNTFLSDASNTTQDLIYFPTVTLAAGSTMELKNNIIGHTTSTTKGRYVTVPTSILGTLAIDYNLYWNNTRAKGFYSASGGEYNWAEWQALGYDVNSPNVTSNLNPILRGFNMYNHLSDFDIKTTSPALNAGTDVGLTHDKFGFEILGVPDIGAIEARSFRFMK